MTKERLSREAIAMRIAREFFDGAVVNLGIGIPTLCSSFVPEGHQVFYHTENGALGFGRVVSEEDKAAFADVDLTNAGGQYIRTKPGMCFFSHADSFAMIRGGKVDISVLGVLEVSENGDLANWMFPGRGVGNIGGGMDLAFCAKRIIGATEHTTKDNKPKIVRKCSIPLTAPACMDMVVTDLAVVKFTRQGPVLAEIAPGWTPDEIQELTEARLIISPDLKEIVLI
ncbi:MAG TPA: 3-oxoacid CoA-transferase subunit B [Dehalococcoidales bacterium]|nr:3-oxoacid CoA-transferase subunit B [Dehalococcoidales bacterium]